MKLTVKQTKAFDAVLSGNRVVCFGGAIRGGKTFWLLTTFSYLALQYPRSRWVIVRRSLPDLKRNTFPSMQTILDNGVNQYVDDWKHDTQTIIFNNKSEIMFMPESYAEDKDLNRFKGLEANGFGFEEINECQEATFEKAIERSGTWLNAKGNPPISILATLNPAQNWTKKRFYEPFRDGTLPNGWVFIQSKITDNPHIPSTYLESIKDMNPIDYARFVEGDWDAVESVENPFLWAFDQRHIVNNTNHNPNIITYFSVDFNINPLCGLVIQHVAGQMNVVDEITIEKGSVEALCDYIKAYGVPMAMIRITGDAMGRGGTIHQRDNSSAYLTMKKLLNISDKQFLIPANPTHKNSREDCNAALTRLDVRVNPKCKGFIYDATQVQCDAEGKILKSNRNNLGQRADYLDSFRYFVNAIMKRYL